MLNINSLEELGTSTIQPVKYLGIFRDIPMDPDKSMGTNTQAQKHSHSKSLSRINLWHNWCNESAEHVGNIQTVQYVTLTLVGQICR